MDPSVSPLTPIERLAFHDHNLAHAVISWSVSPTPLRLGIAPWRDLAQVVYLDFPHVTVLWHDAYDSPSDDFPTLPWDLLGLDARAGDSARWTFVVTTAEVEYGFQADWPHRHASG